MLSKGFFQKTEVNAMKIAYLQTDADGEIITIRIRIVQLIVF